MALLPIVKTRMVSVYVFSCLCFVNRHGISQFGTGPVGSYVVYDIKHSSHLFILIILIALACCGDAGVTNFPFHLKPMYQYERYKNHDSCMISLFILAIPTSI